MKHSSLVCDASIKIVMFNRDLNFQANHLSIMHPEFSTHGPKLTHFNSICVDLIPGAILEKFRGYIATVEGHLCVHHGSRGVYFRMRASSDKAYNKHGTRTSRLTAARAMLYLEEYIARRLISLPLFLSRARACCRILIEWRGYNTRRTASVYPGYAEIVRMPWIPVCFIDRLFCALILPGQSPSEIVLGRIFVDSLSRSADWMNGRCVIRVVLGCTRPTRAAILF